MKKLFFAALTVVSVLACNGVSAQQIYEWRIYREVNAGRLNRYMQEVEIPAYNRYGIQVGAYGEYSMSTPANQYYLFVYPDAATYQKVKQALNEDREYLLAAGKDDPTLPAYRRYDTYICEALSGWPEIDGSNKGSILEWRLYEGANDDAVRRKVKMFNEGEIAVFLEVGIKPQWCSRIVAGPAMPGLMYISRFENMEQRDKAWARFGPHPQWKAMNQKEEYANTTSLNHRRFLDPLPYSQW